MLTTIKLSKSLELLESTSLQFKYAHEYKILYIYFTMKVLTLFTVALMLSSYCSAQIFFNGNTRHVIKKNLTAKIKKNKFNAAISETESTLLYLLRDSTVQNLDYYFQFSESGRCNKEIITLSCDSCFQKYKQALLGNSFLRKVQVNDSLYYGHYPLLHMMEIKTRHNFMLEVTTSSITKHEFREMLKSSTAGVVAERK